MGYRDELAAAQRRIAQLDEQLAELRGEPAEDVAEAVEPTQASYGLLKRLGDELKRRKAAEKRVTQVTDEMSRLQQQSGRNALAREVETLRAQLQGSERRIAELEREVARPLSLWEHNRANPAARPAADTETLCPVCLGLGDRVEMTACPPPAPTGMWADLPHRPVVCPRCLFLGLRRAD